MLRVSSMLVNSALAIAFFGLGPVSRAQTPNSASPVASPSSVSDPKDPPADNATNDARTAGSENADVPAAAPDLQLQAEVQDALSKVPELSNDSLRVAALPDGLELTGNVVSGRERQAAVRIAQSYARGRKVVDHIVVSGRAPVPGETPRSTHQANAQP